MKKILPFILLTILVWWTVWAFFLGKYIIPSFWKENNRANSEQSIESGENKKIDTKKVSSKIEELRQKYALRWLIYEGEAYLQNDQYNLAIKQFMDALEKNPWSDFLVEKIADTYFEMHKYDSAYSYYKKIASPSENIKDKTFLSLLYSKKFDIRNSINILEKEIKDLSFLEEKAFYYKTIIWCSFNLHECKKKFQDEFSKTKERVSFAPLKEIQESFKNYENFQLEDMYYKDSLFVGSIFKQKLYPLVIQVWLDLNKQKPDYRPIIQMIAQSLYEIWEYTSAKKWLELYLKFEPNDKNAWYMMGVINLKIWEYILSNIQLIKASELWYEPKIQLKRRLAYNYYILQQQDRMLSELHSIITETDSFEQEDLYLALYYHIIHNQLDIAIKIAEIGNRQFPDDANIYGYYGWIFKEKWDIVSAEQYIQIWLDKDPLNIFLLLNMGYIYKEKWVTEKALIYFNKVIKEAPKSEFARQAQGVLEELSPQEKSQPQ